MEFSRQAVSAKLKTPAEFITALIALIGMIYGLAWVMDDVVAHVHIRVAHGWWVYQFWHAWWRVLAPILMVAGGATLRPTDPRPVAVGCRCRLANSTRLRGEHGLVWRIANVAGCFIRMGGWYNTEPGRNYSFSFGRGPNGKFGW